MSLGFCPECEHQVSLSAAACPNCGCPFSAPKEQSKSFGLFKSITIAVVVAYGVASWSLGAPATLKDIELLLGVSGPDCENIISQVYNASQENSLQNFGVTIIDIQPTQTLEQTDISVTCRGEAKMSDASSISIEYKMYEDSGQPWVEFRELIFGQ